MARRSELCIRLILSRNNALKHGSGELVSAKDKHAPRIFNELLAFFALTHSIYALQSERYGIIN